MLLFKFTKSEKLDEQKIIFDTFSLSIDQIRNQLVIELGMIKLKLKLEGHIKKYVSRISKAMKNVCSKKQIYKC